MDQSEQVRAFQHGFACAVTAAVVALIQPTGFAQMPGQELPNLPQIRVEQTEHGLRANVGQEVVEITVCRDSVIHVMASPDGPLTSKHPKPWMLGEEQACPGASFRFAQNTSAASVTTQELQVEFSLSRGNLTFMTAEGNRLLREGDSVPRSYEPTEANGEKTYRITDRFGQETMEAVYGLGQHQSGMFNYRGSTVELAQNNTDVAIPLLLSTKGYALLWNTAAFSYVDNRFPGDLALTSIAGNSVDYYFIYGPEMDQIIHEYRSMTGHTPMLAKWAYGFFQSKDRYVSLDQIKQIAGRYRQEHIPFDAIVQDWFWWKTEGDPVFNSNYNDVSADLQTLHQEHVHAMISVWGLFDPRSENYGIMTAHHFDVPGAHVYDATNPAARDFYWNNLAGKLFSMGWDAFWLDSAEPEEYWPHFGDAILRNKMLAIGNGAEYTNVFPLMHNLGVQQHWKAASEQKRVFLLTRSAFLGQQRVGAAVWSGDVYSTWWGLSHQVPAGLNFALSGYPYWTTDIGGYWPPYNGETEEPDYQDLYARWFEFGTFCPIFRTHGHRPENEIWSYPAVEPILIQYDRLRYRLMPYIYSLAWKVASDDYTIQRPLVMDWRTDVKTWNIGDQFMFGPAMMVAPVLEQGATSRRVYLPSAATWYDFWTGNSVPGTQDIQAAAPLDRLPLYIRAGSILPLGPEIEYATEDSGGPIELRIYRGANGSFDLYEDSGDSYDYEKGMHAIIPLRWNDHAGVLMIGTREGSFPQMVTTRQFRIVLVAKGHGVGEAVTAAPDRLITYDGKEVQMTLHR
jgi:alpha-D-xyloside xylohydrolase